LIRRTRKNRSRGFTLLEVIVAVLVISMILTLVWQAFAKTVESKNYVEAGNEMYHQLRWALNKMAYDLSSAYVSRNKNTLSLFLGQSHQNGDGIPQDELNFTSFSHIRYSPTERSSDQCEVGYFILQNPETEQYTLFRREDYTVDEDLTEGGEINELVEGIVAFNIRFYDGEDWSDDWDSRSFQDEDEGFDENSVEQTDVMINAIPIAVEIAASMMDMQGQEVYMTTKVKLMLSTIDIVSDYGESEDSDSDSDKSSDSKSPSSSKSSN
jgi:general secretion pathway protein J